MSVIIYALLIPYYELIFRLYTARSFRADAVLVTLLFSLGAGAFLALLLRVSPHRLLNRIVSLVLLFLVPLLYIIEFLIYRSFKVFYDVNTCVNGAGGAITGFMGDILRLIFCVDGLSAIFLFLLPFILYSVFGIRRIPSSKWKNSDVLFMVSGFVIANALALILVYAIPSLSMMYKEEYNFQSVVEEMGLATGLRLDILKAIRGDKVGFTIEENTGLADYQMAKSETPDIIRTPVPDELAKEYLNSGFFKDINSEEAKEELEAIPTPTPVVEYGYNAYDIDYEALSETVSGTNRDLDLYVASLTPSKQNEYTGKFKGKNLIFITAEAFSGYLVDEERTPTLYRLIHNGFYFEDYYQPAVAGTTGGEYSNLFGLIPTSGGKSMSILTSGSTFTTMGSMLNKEGYYGKAFHNNTNTIYGRNETHNRLGYSDGFMGVGDGMEDYLTTHGFPASDLEMMEGTFPTYVDKQPFNIYYMTVSGHGQYGRSINQMSAKNWDRVADVDCSDKLKAYLANNMELEDALTYLVDALYENDIADDTVIVLSPDHFPYGLDDDASLGKMPYLSELYGFNVVNYLQRESNNCVIWCGELENEEPVTISSPTSSLDLLPTLSNLFGVSFDSRLYPGRDVFSDAPALVFDGAYDWKTDLGTYIASTNTFTPVNEDTEIPEGYVNSVKSIVRNKFSFCKGVLQDDFYGHIEKNIDE